MDTFVDKLASLTPAVRRIICDKATEYPRLGTYVSTIRGSYLCRRCGLGLFRGCDQFEAGCGWPSFDDSLLSNVRQQTDEDGSRTEIVCARCDGHLGHLFINEGYTFKNSRFCVNALSMDFVENPEVCDTEEIIVAGGCFWGVEYYLSQLPGVVKTEVGYIGGTVSDPTYEQVCRGDTGHFEAVRVVFDLSQTDCRSVLRRFFEIHDPTQRMGQGADIGFQYQSAVFYYDDRQHALLNELIAQLKTRGYRVKTKENRMHVFWSAEDGHQQYFLKQEKPIQCHQPVLRFD